MRRGQNMFLVRELSDTAIATEVASVLPTLARRVRRRIAVNERAGTIRTTICPICGGDKLRSSIRCADCHRKATHDGKVKASKAGYRSAGRSAGARAIALESQTPHGDERPIYSGTHKRRGSGTVRPAPGWVRRELVDGRWIEAKGDEDDD